MEGDGNKDPLVKRYIKTHLTDTFIKTDPPVGQSEVELLQSFSKNLFSVAAKTNVLQKLKTFIDIHINPLYIEVEKVSQTGADYISKGEKQVADTKVSVTSQEKNNFQDEPVEVYSRTMDLDMSLDQMKQQNNSRKELQEKSQNYPTFSVDDNKKEGCYVPGNGYERDEIVDYLSHLGILLRQSEMKLIYVPVMAVLVSDLHIIQLCIDTGFNMNLFQCGTLKETLLFLAVKHPIINLNVIMLLLKHIDLNIKSFSHDSVLYIALKNEIKPREKIKLLKLLISSGADCNAVNSFQENILCSYISILSYNDFDLEYWKETINILIGSSDKLLDLKDKYGRSALHKLVKVFPSSSVNWSATYDSNSITRQENCLKIVNYLIAEGSDLSTTDYGGFTLIHSAVQKQNVSLVTLLTEKGCSVNAVSSQGLNPIYYLCISSDAQYYMGGDTDITIQTLKCLAKAGCDPNIPALNGSVALHYAATYLPGNVSECLINVGADANAKDLVQNIPLHSATFNRDVEALEIVFQSVQDANIQNIYQWTPLHCACQSGNLPAIEYLLRKKADISAEAHFGVQPIHMASIDYDSEVINTLVEAGASINATDMWNATPLHYATFSGNSEAAQCLIDLGADRNALDSMQHSPLDLAIATGEYKITHILAGGNRHVHDLIPFPVRPPILQKHLVAHYSNLKEQFLKIGNCETVMDVIMSMPRLQRVKFHCDENQRIKEQVENLVGALTMEIGELDNRFKGTIIKSGSVYEGVKIKYPNEFDYMVNLSSFTESVEELDHFCEGFVGVKVGCNAGDNLHEFITHDGYYNAAKIFNMFSRLLSIASWEIVPKFPCFFSLNTTPPQTDLTFDDDNSSEHSDNLLSFSVGYTDGVYKAFIISLDFNPVIYYKSWPQNALQKSSLISNITSKGIYLIPKKNRDLNTQANTMINHPQTWRISHSHIELEFFSCISEELKNVYSLIKSFLFEPISPKIISLSFVSREYPLVNWTPNGKTDSNKDTNLEIWNQILCGQKPQKQRIEDNFEKMIEEDSSAFESDRSNIELTSYVTTYCVKQIFLTHVDMMVASGELPYGEIMEVTSLETTKLYRTLLYKVYNDLLHAMEVSELKSYFLPKKEIMFPLDLDPYINIEKLIPKFVRSIVDLLKETGFADS